MILESGKTLVVSLGAAVAANQVQVTASYADMSRANGAFLSGSTETLTNGTNRVVVVGMPSSGTQRLIEHMSFYNADTSTATVQVERLASDVSYRVFIHGMLPGDVCEYTPRKGWRSMNSSNGEDIYTNFASVSTANISGIWTSGVSSSLITASQISFTRSLGPGLVPDGTALAPSEAYSSETSLGMYRSAASTLRQSYGTFWPTTIWVDSGLSMIGSTLSSSGLNVASTISCSGLTVSSIATVSRLSSAVSVLAGGLWGSSLSIGNATAGGTAIVAFSSISTKMAAFVVQGSSSSFTIVTWAAVQPGDIIDITIFPDAAVSSLSSGLILHSHCTKAGQVEVRLSNVSTLVQNQSSKSYYLLRTTIF